MRYFLAAALAVTTLGSTAAFAADTLQSTMACPIGGQKFKYLEVVSVSTWGARPDGKPYGSAPFPLPLPVCPNGLVVYREFTAPEKAKLAEVIKTPEYKALAVEAPFYRAAYLERTLQGKPDPVRLLQASWEADGKPVKAKYQREFIDAAQSTMEKGSLTSVAMRLRIANAQRELGEFDKAADTLHSVRPDEIQVTIPQRDRDANGNIVNADAIEEAESRRSWVPYVGRLEAVIARHDASAEPKEFKPEGDD